jgi:hypothetical protein
MIWGLRYDLGTIRVVQLLASQLTLCEATQTQQQK